MNKIKSSSIDEVLNVEDQAINLLEENVGEYAYDFGIWEAFLSETPKAYAREQD